MDRVQDGGLAWKSSRMRSCGVQTMTHRSQNKPFTDGEAYAHVAVALAGLSVLKAHLGHHVLRSCRTRSSESRSPDSESDFCIVDDQQRNSESGESPAGQGVPVGSCKWACEDHLYQ